ncbi:substrate-binding domain-containing protein [Amycolatopsis mongoliensis]|uniref:Substrate-binding domain-containing protein n=1 Tax=Amycolatopsis mongoliensis TaxID=715475 RepID=A0A9Y2JL02_9PSEU|nr:substrate-binding domain-containing protein [Amycolatopsis sp. 4-36]WIX99977.1 substrate-binding domain-containing protein [Amycolatopsis sp. 4-36]
MRREESAAERTEVITRHDDTSGDYPITARNEPSGAFRAVGRGENTGSHRTLEREEATDSETTSRRGRRHREAADDENPGRRRVPGRSDTTAPSGKSETTGSHRTLGKGEATGSHRIVGKKAPRRRIATWPIACAVLAALIGLGVIGWNWADSELNSRAEAQAASCSGGTSQMRILVTPSVQKPVTAAADRWNQAATVVHGQCVHVTVEAKPSAQVLDALVGRTNLDAIGGLPAAWLPESSYWVSELTTKKPEMIGSPAQSVASARSADYPFIGLTGQGIDDTVLRAAQTFREYLEQPPQQADFAAAGIKTA